MTCPSASGRRGPARQGRGSRALRRAAPALRLLKPGTRLHGLLLLLAPAYTERRYRTCLECKRRRLAWDGGWSASLLVSDMTRTPGCRHAKGIDRGTVTCGLGLFGGSPHVGTCLRDCAMRSGGPPGVGSQAMNLYRTLQETARMPQKLVPDDVKASRMEKCLACPHWDADRRVARCVKCGCTTIKQHLSAAACPIGKWGKWLPDKDLP